MNRTLHGFCIEPEWKIPDGWVAVAPLVRGESPAPEGAAPDEAIKEDRAKRVSLD